MTRINLPKETFKEILHEVYAKADKFGYAKCDRVQSGQFMDSLVTDSNVGLRLEEFMPKEKVRTYIKDTILNRYTKQANIKALDLITSEETIIECFNEDAKVIDNVVSKGNVLSILRASATSHIFVVSSGTTLKWETALRRALELIASKPNLTINGKVPFICLKLSCANGTLTDADKMAIQFSLGVVGVKALFCEL